MSPDGPGRMVEVSGVRAMLEVARKEALQLLRTKRLLAVGAALVVTMVLLTLVLPLSFSAFLEDIRAGLAPGDSLQNFVLLFFLSGFFILSGYFFIQLLPLLLTADAVCSEWSNRTIFLLLSKPVPRWAFVVGKYLGIAVPVAAFIAGLLILDYLALWAFLDGSPDAAAVGRFFAALAVIVLGVLAFSAIALFFSTLVRSSVVSILLAVVAWIIVLPLLGQTAFFIDLASEGEDAFTHDGARWSEYLSPGSMMGAASRALVTDDETRFFGVFGGGTEAEPWAAGLALAGQSAFFVALSVLVVWRRNFE